MSGRVLAILWDIDGTLADSEPLHGKIMRGVLESHGVPYADAGETLGKSCETIHARLSSRHASMPPLRGFIDEVNERYVERAGEIKAKQGALAACEKFAGEGREQAAVSNSAPEIVDATLGAIGARGYMSCVVSCDGLGRAKPHPDPYLRAMKKLGVESGEAICFEDSEVGCAAARAAGLFVVGLPENGADIGAHVHFSKIPDESPERLLREHGR